MVVRHATRITAAERDVTVVSGTRAVTDWALRYLGRWWQAAEAGAPFTEPLVSADVDENQFAKYVQHLTSRAHRQTVYANAPTLYENGSGGMVTAAQPGDRLGYRVRPGHIRIVGCDEESVALAAARLAREVVRGRLLQEGWSILRASAVVRGDRTILVLGSHGAGKTTCALLLARCGWQLLANDRVFVRPAGDGVRVLPWPSAAAIGLGLLDALDLYDPVREHTLRGERLHPTQDRRVTDALAAGHRTPLWNDNGRELKPQFFPDQLADWLGLALAAEGRASCLLFPRTSPTATAAETHEDRRIGEDDFFTGTTEARYPDIFRILPDQRATVGPALACLARLPRHTLTLGHHVEDNTALLTLVSTVGPKDGVSREA
ncbi:hypothetical protein [Streptomyces telluris]|uniref:Uncharacterized protein n=1 Tax=Streptomyces telluris TaxID=2720021 RepID=A0A9X2LHD4_9ACTN|nr:hypothetical protein [Streptomyces telluris]MCQ8771347.1 hypothetical protein [Streptomyces telluris]